MPEGGGPGANDPFDPDDLDDVLARVVMPVVSSIIKPGELQQVDLGWGPRLPEGEEEKADRELLSTTYGIEADNGGNDLYVLVVASGRTFEWPVWKPEFREPGETLDSIAFSFADVLEDFVFDCVAPWGELRIARYAIPERRSSPHS